MGPAGCADRNHIDLGIRQHRLQIIVRRAAEFSRERTGFFHRATMARYQLRASKFRYSSSVKFGDHATADYCPSGHLVVLLSGDVGNGWSNCTRRFSLSV